MKTAWLGLAMVLAWGASAEAAGLRIHNGSSVHVAVHGKRETGVGLKAQKGGWKLALDVSADQVADVLDVTDGFNGTRWTVDATDGGGLFFDAERFIAGHAYRVTVRKGTEAVGSTLVYLYPPTAAAKSHVSFEDEADGAGDGEIAITKKPTL